MKYRKACLSGGTRNPLENEKRNIVTYSMNVIFPGGRSATVEVSGDAPKRGFYPEKIERDFLREFNSKLAPEAEKAVRCKYMRNVRPGGIEIDEVLGAAFRVDGNGKRLERVY